MKQILLSSLLAFSIAGCVTGNSNKLEAEADVAKKAATEKAAVVGASSGIKVQSPVPYMKGAMIAANIKNECHIDQQLSEFIFSYSADQGIDIILQDQVTENTKGLALVVEITNAVSSGNAFIGHRKFTSVEGTLYKDGNKEAGFTAARLSGGGFFGGYKGSCSVLGRTVKTLGKDISVWLQNPVDGVHLGDGV